MRFEAIERCAGQYPVRRLCDVLEVSPSGYYAWQGRPESQRCREDRSLEAQVRTIFEESRRTYGSPRVLAELQERGMRVSRKRVARLMRSSGLRSRRRKKFRVTTRAHPGRPVAPNRLGRRFRVTALNRVWLGDITYIATREGWLYLAVLMDLCSRRVVGWASGDRLTEELAHRALKMALLQRRPEPGLLHHSDRGCQYSAASYQELLKTAGVTISMSGKGDCWDNAPMESLFATLKLEWILHRNYETRAEARRDLFELLEVFYNRQRRHSALGYQSPVDFESRPQMEILSAQNLRRATRFRRTTEVEPLSQHHRKRA